MAGVDNACVTCRDDRASVSGDREHRQCQGGVPVHHGQGAGETRHEAD